LRVKRHIVTRGSIQLSRVAASDWEARKTLVDEDEPLAGEPPCRALALASGVEQGAQLLHPGVERFERGMVACFQAVEPFAQGGQHPAVASDLRGDPACQLQEVMVDQADGMEAVGHDPNTAAMPATI